MLNRRGFVSCALCAATGLVAAAVSASPAAAATLSRTILRRADGPAEGYETIQVMVEVPAGGMIPRHTHPGVESAYVLSGSGTLSVQGQPDQAMPEGSSSLVPAGTPHSVAVGGAPMRIAVTYVVEKSKPLVTLVPG